MPSVTRNTGVGAGGGAGSAAFGAAAGAGETVLSTEAGGNAALFVGAGGGAASGGVGDAHAAMRIDHAVKLNEPRVMRA